jgi:chemotaxis-related protein WspB
MLFVTFQLDAHRYAIDAATIQEVLPLVEVRTMPQAPAGVAGVFDFRGTPVPVIDVSLLLSGRASRACSSTRLIVVGYRDRDDATRPLGLIVEQATRTMRRERGDFVDAGLGNRAAPYLGCVTRDDGALVQWLDVPRLLPPAVRDVLYTPQVETEWAPTSRAC